MSAAQEFPMLPAQHHQHALAPVIPLSFSPRRAVEEHLDLVSVVLNRIGQRIPAHVERADLLQAGVVGLLDAAEKYEPSTRVHFRAYAEIRIRGAILDSLRGMDRVGRTLRRRINSLRHAERRLSQVLGRRPTDHELAEELGLSLEVLTAARVEAEVQVVSLETSGQEGSPALVDRVTDHRASSALDALCEESLRAEVRRALRALPERERMVIELSFFEEKTLKEIGELLGVTESRTCQLRNQAVARLQKFLSSSSSSF